MPSLEKQSLVLYAYLPSVSFAPAEVVQNITPWVSNQVIMEFETLLDEA
jgi:hypothetical protein